MQDVQDFIETYGYWGNHPDHHPSDWEDEVTNGDTRLGYWEWVAARINNG
jgi:hypothetical protein